MPVHDELLRHTSGLAECFAAAGHRLYAVGGVVRDLALGRPWTGDIDLTTDALPSQIKQLVRGRAEAVWTQGERFGTIGCVIDGQAYEITTHRSEAYDESSRKPTVEFTTAVDADLSRRDFTVNAMAVDLSTGDLVDPFGGGADLVAGVLRTPLGPEASFSDDPLRMIRAARFVAAFDLIPVDDVVRAMTTMRDRVTIVAVERLRMELDKLLALPRPGPGLALLDRTGLIGFLLPELAAAPDGVRQRMIAAVDGSPPDVVVRLAVLLEAGPVAGAAHRLRALRSPNEQVDGVVALLGGLAVLDGGGTIDDALIRRIEVAIDGEAEGFASLVAVVRPGEVADTYLARRRAVADAGELDELGPALDGAEVMDLLDLEPGPDVGRAMAFLTELRLTEGSRPWAQVVQHLRNWWVGAGPSGTPRR